MRGTPRGRPPKLTEDDLEAARALLANADIPVTAIVHRLVGVSRANFYRYITAALPCETPLEMLFYSTG
jgi:AcrR family transcriptional regulator